MTSSSFLRRLRLGSALLVLAWQAPATAAEFDQFPFTAYRYELTKTTTSDSTDTMRLRETQKGTVVAAETPGGRRFLAGFTTTTTGEEDTSEPAIVSRTVVMEADGVTYLVMGSAQPGDEVAVEMRPPGDSAAILLHRIQYGEEAMPFVRGELPNGPSLRSLLEKRETAGLVESEEGGLRVLRAPVPGSPPTRIEFRLDPAQEGRLVAIDWSIDDRRRILGAEIVYTRVGEALFPSRVTVQRNTGYDIRTSVMEISRVETDPTLPADFFTPKGLADWLGNPRLGFLRSENGDVREYMLEGDRLVPRPERPQSATDADNRLGLWIIAAAVASVSACTLIVLGFLFATRRRS